MNYIQAENLKHKRTFTKKLMILAPLITVLINGLAPLWFQVNSFNWWYVFLYPGFLTLICVLVEQRDNGKLKYIAVFSLLVSLEKVWKAKIGLVGIYACVGNLIFLILNLAGGLVLLFTNELELKISVWEALAGTVCIVLVNLWQIPLCLWLSKKVGVFGTMMLNTGLGSILGVLFAATSVWFLCPYSWVPYLMTWVLGILPNGVPVTEQTGTIPYFMLSVIVFSSLGLFGVLSFCTGKWFEKRGMEK